MFDLQMKVMYRDAYPANTYLLSKRRTQLICRVFGLVDIFFSEIKNRIAYTNSRIAQYYWAVFEIERFTDSQVLLTALN